MTVSQAQVLQASRTLAAGVQSVRGVLPAFQACQAPGGPEELQQLLAPVATQLEAAGKLGSGSRSPYINHFKVVGEAAQALSWVAYSGPECGEWVCPEGQGAPCEEGRCQCIARVARGTDIEGSSVPFPSTGMRSPPDHVSDASQAAEFYAIKVILGRSMPISKPGVHCDEFQRTGSSPARSSGCTPIIHYRS